MCGIVGYVGDKQALEVVVEGLRRLEYRGYDSAGVAILDRGRRALQVERKAGKLANLEKVLAEHELPRHRSASATPAGRPTARPPTPTPTRTSTAPGAVAVVHNGTIENYEELVARARGARPRAPLRHRHRGRRPPARGALRRRPDRRATCRRACARSARTSRARSSWSSPTATSPTSSSPPAATCRWSSASARARTSSAPT